MTLTATTKPTARGDVSPRSLDAEAGVIASVLLDGRMLDEVLLVISAGDFLSSEHQRLFEIITTLHNSNKPFDFLIILEKLKAIKNDEQRQTMIAALTATTERVPTAANAVWYAKAIREAAIKRDIIHAGNSMVAMAQDSDSADELVSQSESMIFALSERRTGLDAIPLTDVLFAAMEELQSREKGSSPGIRCGLASMDDRHNGMRPGELIILAARPSMGKSALAGVIAKNAAMMFDKSVLFVSLEMSRLELGERLLCSHGRIDAKDFREGKLSPEQSRKAVRAQSELSTAKIHIDDAPSRSVSEIGAMARRQKRRHGLDLLIIDYLQLIRPENGREPRQEQVAKIARQLKGLARELNVPLLCLAQINREAEKRTDNKPKLSDLRESGAIEQDADVVWFVHREAYFMPEGDEKIAKKEEAEIITAKFRNGAPGPNKVRWLGRYGIFESAEKPAERYDFT